MKISVRNNFNTRILVEREDEIGQIAASFNDLLDRSNALVKDLVKKEVTQKDAQFKALQYQINPHFIYNTLEIFAARMELAGSYDTADALSAFGKILRYNTGRKSVFISLQSEVLNVSSYIAIEKLIHKERLRLHVHLPQALSQLKTVKFILQPIVENSVKHGMGESHLDIHIGFTLDKDTLKITIEDNGKGIEPELLKAMNQDFQRTTNESEPENLERGIGLKNINDRLKLFYGSAYFLRMESEKGGYTRTIITLPELSGN